VAQPSQSRHHGEVPPTGADRPPYVADFACVAEHLIVELDGKPHDNPERQDRDRHRDTWLSEHGWRVLRIPNDIVIGGGDIVIERIKAALPLPSSDPR